MLCSGIIKQNNQEKASDSIMGEMAMHQTTCSCNHFVRLAVLLIASLAALIACCLSVPEQAHAEQTWLGTDAYNGNKVYYDNTRRMYTTYFWIDGHVAYCCQPANATPISGNYWKNYWNNSTASAILYFGYGGPGWDYAKNNGWWPQWNADGNWMSDADYYVATHILISWAYGSDYFHGASWYYRNWANDNLFGWVINNLNNNAWRVPQSFKNNVYWMDTGWNTPRGTQGQDVVSYNWVNAGGIQINKKEAKTNRNLGGITFGIYNSDSNGNWGGRVSSITTDGSGNAQTRENELPVGWYRLWEDNPPAGCDNLSSDPIYVSDNFSYAWCSASNGNVNWNKRWDRVQLYNVAYTSYSANKHWNVKRAPSENFQLTLMRNGVAFDTVSFSNPSQGWKTDFSYTWNKLQKYDDNGQPYTYTVKETNEENGIASFDDGKKYKVEYANNGTSTNIINTEVKDITVNKQWIDNDNSYNTRPRTLEICLRRIKSGETNNTIIDKVNLTADNNWTYTWQNMPLVDSDGKQCFYSLVENLTEPTSSLYTKSSGSGDEYHTTFTNILNVTNVKVNKRWIGSNVRPSGVRVVLKDKAGKEYKSAILNASNNWSISFDGLPVFDQGGTKIDYTLEEDSVSGYIASINKTEKSDGSIVFDVKNVSDETRNIPVSKKWQGNASIPDSIVFVLYRNNFATNTTLTLTKSTGWSGSFTGLPKYDSNGDIIQYTVKEQDSVGYAYDISGTMDSGYNVTNYYGATQVTVNKVWDDNNNAEKKRPANITIKLLANNTDTNKTLILSSSNNWKGAFTNLRKYDDNGTEIKYSVKENSVIFYSDSYSETSTNTFTITNHYSANDTTVSMNKIWDDDNNKAGLRTDSIDVSLYRVSSTKTDKFSIGKRKDLTVKTTTKINQNRYIFKYTKKDGKTPFESNLGAAIITWSTLPSSTDDMYNNITNSQTIYADSNGVFDVTLGSNQGIVLPYSERPLIPELKNFEYWKTLDFGGMRYIAMNTGTQQIYQWPTSFIVDDNNQLVQEFHMEPLIDDSTGGLTSINYAIKGSEESSPEYGYSDKINVFSSIDDYKNGFFTSACEFAGINKDDIEINLPITSDLYIASNSNVKTADSKTISHKLGFYFNNPSESDMSVNIVSYNQKNGSTNECVTNKQPFTALPGFHYYIIPYDDVASDVYSFESSNKNLPISYVDSLVRFSSSSETAKQKIGTYKLTKENNWDLKINKDKFANNGSPYSYYIEEDAIPNHYTSEIYSNNSALQSNTKYYSTENDTNTPVTFAGTTTNRPTTSTGTGTSTAFPLSIKYGNYGGTELRNIADDIAKKGVKSTYYDSIETLMNSDKYGTVKLVDGTTAYIRLIGINQDIRNADNTYAGLTFQIWGALPNAILFNDLQTELNKMFFGTTAKNTNNLIPNIKKRKFGTTSYNSSKAFLLSSAEILPSEYVRYSYTVYSEYIKPDHTYMFYNNSYKTFNYAKAIFCWSLKNNAMTVGSPAANSETVNSSYFQFLRTGVLTTMNSTINDSNRLAINAAYGITSYNAKKGSISPAFCIGTEELSANKETNTITDPSFDYTIKNTIGELRTVKVTKFWDDNDNMLGKRPASVTIKLYADGVATGKTLTLSTANSWSGEFADLPITNDSGTNINYTVSEDRASCYQVPIIHDSGNNNYSIINALPTTNVKVTKTWDDNNDQLNKRPSAVIVYLYANGKQVDEASITSTNNWTYTFDNLQKYDDNNIEIKYTISEKDVQDYSKSIVSTATNTYTITNSLSKRDISVHKEWDLVNNDSSLLPASLSVTLYANGAAKQTATLNEQNNWSYIFSNLDYKDSSGNVINYTVDENAFSGGDKFTKKITGDATSGYTITNSEKISIPVTKAWNDQDNIDGIRPSSITVTLYADGVSTGKTLTLNAGNSWSGTFTNLDKRNASNSDVKYEVRENNVPSGYTATISGSASTGYQVVNSHDRQYCSVNIEKHWDDNDNQDKVRPSSITARLYQNGKLYAGKTATLNESNGWKYTFSKLPWKDSNGNEYVYTIQEDAVTDYTPAYSTSDDGTLVITNKHESKTRDIPVIKKWVNDEGIAKPSKVTVGLYQNGSRIKTIDLTAAGNWEGKFTDLPIYPTGGGDMYQYTVKEESTSPDWASTVGGDMDHGYVVTNIGNRSNLAVSGIKEWLGDTPDQRPASITVRLYKDDVEIASKVVTPGPNGEWAFKFDNLDAVNSGGQAANYEVKEDPVPGYTAEYGYTSDGETYRITNRKTKSLTVTKKWNDDNDARGSRPSSIKANLIAKKYSNEMGLVYNNADKAYPFNAKLSDDDFTIAATFDGTVTTAKITQTDSKGITRGSTAINVNGDTAEHLASIGKIKDLGTLIKVTDASGKDISSHVIRLLIRDNAQSTNVAMTVELNAGNNWSWTFDDLRINDNKGFPFEYTVEEENVYGYTGTLSGNEQSGYTLTNTEQKSIKFSKQWIGSDGKKISPSGVSATINLMRNGQKFQSKQVTSATNWSGEFTNIPWRDSNGNIYEYTIQEEPVNGWYLMGVTGDATSGYTITNGKTTNVSAVKNWVGDSSNTSTRPSLVTAVLERNVDLTIGGSVMSLDSIASLVQSSMAAGNDSYGVPSSIDVNVKASSNAERGTVKLVLTDGQKEYDKKFVTFDSSSDSVASFDTSSIPSGAKSLYVAVTAISDNDTQLDEQLTSGAVVITANANWSGDVQEKQLSSSNNWRASFDSLPVIDSIGSKLSYKVREKSVPSGYAVSYSSNGDAWTITNTYDKINIPVKKIWNDLDNKDGGRPSSVVVELLANGTATGKKVTLSSDNDWHAEFTSLDKKSGGRNITYTIRENNVPSGYTVSISGSQSGGFTVTNTHNVKTSVTVVKQWDDQSNAGGKRPSGIILHLFANGKEVASARVENDGNGNWSKTFDNLDYADQNGNLIKYTVSEDSVSGYKLLDIKGDQSTGYTIVNWTQAPVLLPNTGLRGYIGLIAGGIIVMWIGSLFVRRSHRRVKEIR